MSTELAIQRGVERTQLSHEKISQLLNSVPESLIPIKETIALLHHLKDTPNKLYVLSNMHNASMNYLEKNHSFWIVFGGKVFSCEVHKIKPEPEIYEHLLNKFKLEANKTIFIDDMLENLDAATQFGIKTIHFQNAKQCFKGLKKLALI